MRAVRGEGRSEEGLMGTKPCERRPGGGPGLRTARIRTARAAGAQDGVDGVKEYTAFFAFCGVGGGALGFQRAETHLLGQRARIRVLGGFDIDPTACATSPALARSARTCAS